jgi:hypothetical protein
MNDGCTTIIKSQAKVTKPGPKPRPLGERFWVKVNKDGPVPVHCPELGPCWVCRDYAVGQQARQARLHGMPGPAILTVTARDEGDHQCGTLASSKRSRLP